MVKKTIRIRTLTPIWTGDAEGKPTGLKLTGILGSMRIMFEALVREAGGHTCDITGDRTACNHEKPEKVCVCPACQVFGCTGLSRAFKINWELPKANKLGPLYVPEEDLSTTWKNRNHDMDMENPYPTSIDTWMASPLRDVRGVFKPGEHNLARSVLSTKLNPAFSPEYTNLEIVELRKIPGIDVLEVVSELLTQMADRYAIGAKVNQGWGFIELDQESRSEGIPEIAKLVKASSFDAPGDKTFPQFNYIAFPELVVNYKNMTKGQKNEDSLNFQWGSNPLKNNLPVVALGYALQYRLRRIVKFEAFSEVSDDEIVFLDEINRDVEYWAKANSDLVEQYYRGYPSLEWKKDGAFAEYLFGSAVNGKHAGFIGVSHLYKRDDGKWYVRMISQCPEREFAEHIYAEFQYQINQTFSKS